MDFSDYDPSDETPWSEAEALTKVREFAVSFPSVELLASKNPWQVLERVSSEDPFRIRLRCVQVLRSRALLFDLEQLTLRAMGVVAIHGLHYAGEPPVAEWLDERIEEALEMLCEEDRELDRREPLERELGYPRFQLMIQVLGIEPRWARRACIVVNDLPDRIRKTFYHLVVLRTTVNEYRARAGTSRESVLDDLERALGSLRALGSERKGRER